MRNKPEMSEKAEIGDKTMCDETMSDETVSDLSRSLSETDALSMENVHQAVEKVRYMCNPCVRICDNVHVLVGNHSVG